MITEAELNVLKVMAEKDINWNWMNLDRALSFRGIPGFSNVVNIVNKLASEGLVNIEDSGHKSMPYYRVSEQGYKLLKNNSDRGSAQKQQALFHRRGPLISVSRR